MLTFAMGTLPNKTGNSKTCDNDSSDCRSNSIGGCVVQMLGRGADSGVLPLIATYLGGEPLLVRPGPHDCPDSQRLLAQFNRAAVNGKVSYCDHLERTISALRAECVNIMHARRNMLAKVVLTVESLELERKKKRNAVEKYVPPEWIVGPRGDDSSSDNEGTSSDDGESNSAFIPEHIQQWSVGHLVRATMIRIAIQIEESERSSSMYPKEEVNMLAQTVLVAGTGVGCGQGITQMFREFFPEDL